MNFEASYLGKRTLQPQCDFLLIFCGRGRWQGAVKCIAQPLLQTPVTFVNRSCDLGFLLLRNIHG